MMNKIFFTLSRMACITACLLSVTKMPLHATVGGVVHVARADVGRADGQSTRVLFLGLQHDASDALIASQHDALQQLIEQKLGREIQHPTHAYHPPRVVPARSLGLILEMTVGLLELHTLRKHGTQAFITEQLGNKPACLPLASLMHPVITHDPSGTGDTMHSSASRRTSAGTCHVSLFDTRDAVEHAMTLFFHAAEVAIKTNLNPHIRQQAAQLLPLLNNNMQQFITTLHSMQGILPALAQSGHPLAQTHRWLRDPSVDSWLAMRTAAIRETLAATEEHLARLSTAPHELTQHLARKTTETLQLMEHALRTAQTAPGAQRQASMMDVLTTLKETCLRAACLPESACSRRDLQFLQAFLKNDEHLHKMEDALSFHCDLTLLNQILTGIERGDELIVIPAGDAHVQNVLRWLRMMTNLEVREVGAEELQAGDANPDPATLPRILECLVSTQQAPAMATPPAGEAEECRQPTDHAFTPQETTRSAKRRERKKRAEAARRTQEQQETQFTPTDHEGSAEAVEAPAPEEPAAPQPEAAPATAPRPRTKPAQQTFAGLGGLRGAFGK